MSLKLMVTLVLALPGVAAAQEPGNPPVDPPIGAEEGPDTERQAPLSEAATLRAELGQTERMLEKAYEVVARLEAEAEAERTAADDASEELEGARTDRDLSETQAGSAMDVAWYEVEKDREALKAAKQAKKLRKSELKLERQRGDREGIALASAALSAAKRDLAARRAELEVSRAQYRQARADRQRVRDQQEKAVASAKVERSAAMDRADLAVSELDLAKARVEVLQARRDRIVAQMAHNEARSVLGAEQDLEDLAEALEQAREREDAAIIRMRELERAMGTTTPSSPSEPISP